MEEDNWLRLHMALDHVKLDLRNILISLWRTLYGSEWKNSPECQSFLKKLVKQGTANLAYNPLKRCVERRDIHHWTLETILCALRILGIQWLPQSAFFLVRTATEINNFLTFHPSKVFPRAIVDEKFATLLEDLSNFRSLGPICMIVMDIESDMLNISSLRSPKITDPEAAKLNEAAIAFSREDNHEKAIQLTLNGLERLSLKEKEKGVLFSNCSAYFLKWAQNSFDEEKEFYAKEAVNEAKRAISLLPKWSEPYAHLGRAYETLRKYHKAVSAYGEALKLKPSSVEIKQRRDFCLEKVNQQRTGRQASIDMWLFSLQFMNNLINQKLEDPNCTDAEFERTIQALKQQITVDSDLIEALRHHYGWKKPVNLDLACKHYFLSACRGEAQSMYSLAMMLKNGKGINKDCHLALKVLKNVSKLPPFHEFGKRNYGVLEGIYMIGVMHEGGIGITISSKRAFKWFKRAADWGLRESLYKVGLMYHVGLGVEQNPELAVSAWYKAFARGCDRSLILLAKRLAAIGEFDELDRIKEIVTKEDSEFDKEAHAEFKKICNSRDQESTCSKSEGKLGKSSSKLFSPEALQEHVRMHRAKMSKAAKKAKRSSSSQVKRVPVHHSIPVLLHILADFESLVFLDMCPEPTMRREVYNDSFIQVVVADDPVEIGSEIAVILEDRQGQVLPAVLHNIRNGPWLKFGTILFIKNPCLERNGSGKFALRVDSYEALYFHDEGLNDRCRCCRKKTSRVPCPKCKRVFYCSDECREKDVALFNHDLVCGLKVNSGNK